MATSQPAEAEDIRIGTQCETMRKEEQTEAFSHKREEGTVKKKYQEIHHCDKRYRTFVEDGQASKRRVGPLTIPFTMQREKPKDSD
jgi:hypothetical protein